ncbi:MAG: tRNA (guanosine(46)-N7)-methyltransferase TrmB [Phycisphaeraceae bacterium]|nr:tRNA (guanosine(46)-N7)-methyltransferase TrmB [Phycisphaeraceae bacterium]
MSFGLSRGRSLDVAPGVVALDAIEIPPLPDDVLTNPEAGWLNLSGLFRTPEFPLEIEIGSGKGTFLVQEARARPTTNFLGIEWAKEFFAYAADRIRRQQVGNVRLLHADAVEFLRWRVPDASVSVIHLYFSDPWPKTRHHKNRVVQDRFLADAHRTLIPGGELRIVTDHDGYWAWMEEHFARWCSPGTGEDHPLFARVAFAPPVGAGVGELVGTNFERKYAREGRPFHATTLVKPLGLERGPAT